MNSQLHNKLPDEFAKSAGYMLNQTAQVIGEMVTEALKPLKLAPQEYGVMRVISISGPVSQQTFADRYNIDRTMVTGLVDGLEKRGYVDRQRSTTDRRVNLMHLTPLGKRALAQAVRTVKKAQAEFLAPLTDEEWEATRVSLVKLLEAHRPM
jgi:Transcriptional regulators